MQHDQEQQQDSKLRTSEQYEAHIRDCFRCWPHAAPFYQTLIDYLRTASNTGFSPLQTPTTYLLGHDFGKKAEIEPSSPQAQRRSSLPLFISTPARGSITSRRTRPAHQSHITVVEGFLAPETIGILGDMYQTRPEFFIDHLEPGYGYGTGTSTGQYELPNLPSKRDNIIHVRFMSMLHIPGEPEQPFSSSLASRFEQRTLLESRRCRYEQRLFQHRHYGATRFRALHVHRERRLTVEQMVSFSVKREGKNWQGLFLLDSGRDCEEVDLPWAEYVRVAAEAAAVAGGAADDHDTGFVPIIPYNLPVIGDAALKDNGDNNFNSPLKQHCPYHPAVDMLLAAASPETAQLLVEDPFFILSCVYHAAARTRIQLLSFIESDVLECSAATSGGSASGLERQSVVLDQLRFNLQLVRRVERFCKEDLGIIARGGSAAWPRCSERLAAEMELVKDQLQEDYAFLIEQCGSLALRCETASNTLVSLAQWMDAREGIRESRNVANLTILAFVFIPLSYITSCLSMNVTGVMDGVPIWIWGAASGISVVITGTVVVVLRGWWRGW